LSRSRWLGNALAACAAILTCLWSVPLDAQSGATPVLRHHVLFLLDSSGSVFHAPYGRAEYQRVLRDELPGLLADGQRNGFGVSIYDRNEDVSTAFSFGLSQDQPFFAPENPSGFIHD